MLKLSGLDNLTLITLDAILLCCISIPFVFVLSIIVAGIVFMELGIGVLIISSIMMVIEFNLLSWIIFFTCSRNVTYGLIGVIAVFCTLFIIGSSLFPGINPFMVTVLSWVPSQQPLFLAKMALLSQ